MYKSYALLKHTLLKKDIGFSRNTLAIVVADINDYAVFCMI